MGAGVPRGVGTILGIWGPGPARTTFSRPILLARRWVNQMLPSGPDVMSKGRLSGNGIGNSVMAPAVVIRPILLPGPSVNHRLPSGPAAIPVGALPAGRANSETAPVAVTRPIRSSPPSPE